jgi:polysaccharide export outer membrane protein
MQSKYHNGWLVKLRTVAALIVALTLSVTAARAVDQLIPDTSGASSEGAPTGELPPSETVSSTYALSPYDVVDISVYGEADLHTRTRLGSDGTVILPLIGTLSLGGLTVSKANDLIQKRYADGFVKDPHVLVTVLEFRKSTFSIIGQVVRPGIYEIPQGTQLSIVDAILLAGGFTHIANENGVKVKRVVKGKAEVFTVKAGKMADSPDVAPFDIEPGDIIKVNESWW